MSKKKSPGLNKQFVIAGVVAAALLGGAVWWMSAPQPGSSLSLAAQAGTVAQPENPIAGAILGQVEAPVTLVEYASFTCPHCKAFHDSVLPQIKKDFIDTGKVKLEFREFYLNEFDLNAGIVAQCAGPMRYFGIVDILFKEQGSWPAGGNAAAARTNLITIGKRAGMTDEQLNACFQDNDLRTRMVQTFQWHGTTDEVRGTPSFMINGVKAANAPYPEFAKALEDAYAKATGN